MQVLDSHRDFSTTGAGGYSDFQCPNIPEHGTKPLPPIEGVDCDRSQRLAEREPVDEQNRVSLAQGTPGLGQFFRRQGRSRGHRGQLDHTERREANACREVMLGYRELSDHKMERLVFFGKGGIGKSTTSTNVSATLAGLGVRAARRGRDHRLHRRPAHGRMIEAVVDKPINLDSVRPGTSSTAPASKTALRPAGPAPAWAAVAAASRGCSASFNAAKLLDSGRYDTCIFDILGDVVRRLRIAAQERLRREGRHCRLRRGDGPVRGEQIAKAVVNYSGNGVVLAGIILNLRDNREDREPRTASRSC